MNFIVNTVAAMETGIMLNTNLHVTFPDIPGIQEKSPWMKFSWTGIIVHVNIKSAMAMLAIEQVHGAGRVRLPTTRLNCRAKRW